MQEHGAGPALAGTRRRTGLLAAAAAITLALDQLTKVWAASALADRDIDLVGSLRLHVERNRGGAFGLNQGRGGLVGIAALLVVVAVVWVGRTVAGRAGAIAVGMILGGALGNLADRAIREGSGFLGGGVVDFIDLQWWPIFNVADIAVTTGAILLVLVSSREPRAR